MLDEHSEVWRPVVDFEGYYEVSDHGRVRSVSRVSRSRPGRTRRVPGKVLQPGLTKGYQSVSLSNDGAVKKARVHRIVCLAFHGRPPTVEHEVRHLNGDCLDNRAENLCWGTRSENGLDRVRHGTDLDALKTGCPKGHPYDAQNTYVNRRGHRACRACHSAYQRVIRAKAKQFA